MRLRPGWVPLCGLLAAFGPAGAAGSCDLPEAVWKSLPEMPGGVGFAAMYAGESGGVLLAGGGANFPPASGIEPAKTWHDTLYVLHPGAAQWVPAGRLPRAGAYGVSASWRGRVVCAGGSDAKGAFATAWMLEWTEAGVRIEPLPELPVALEFAAGAVVGDSFYVLGGGSADAGPGDSRMFALGLAAPPAARRWIELPWPEGAPGRRLAVAGASGGTLYLFGGLAPEGSGQTPAGNRHLRDAYAFEPGRGWRRLADLPRGVAGAAGPALALGDGRLAIWGGLDAPWAELRATMSAFESGLLFYDPVADRWQQQPAGSADPARFPSRLTASTVPWGAGHAIIGGETAPRVRTTTTPLLEFR